MTFIARRQTPRPKALWYQLQKNPKKKKPVHRLPQFSKNRQERLREYKKMRAEFMRLNPVCAAPQCGKPSTELHHQRGRRHSLLTDLRFFSAVCHKCHDRIGSDPVWARSVGMIGPVGSWNTPVK